MSDDTWENNTQANQAMAMVTKLALNLMRRFIAQILVRTVEDLDSNKGSLVG